jgi:hypothetical protein
MKWEDIPDVTGQHTKEQVEEQFLFWTKQHTIIANGEYDERMKPILAERRRKLVETVKPLLGQTKTVTGQVETWESSQGNEHYSVSELEDEILSELPEYCHVKVSVEVIGPKD